MQDEKNVNTIAMPEPTALQKAEYKQVCHNFAEMMYKELIDNHHKGGRVGPNGWLNAQPSLLVDEINYHAAKLTGAVLDGNRLLVDEHSADVANLCLMLTEKSGTKYMTPIPFKIYDKQIAPEPIVDVAEIDRKVYRLIINEVIRAETKHPNFANDPVHRAAVVAEEAGELVRASLQYEYEGGALEEVIKEAVQTAATAVRILKIPLYEYLLDKALKPKPATNNIKALPEITIHDDTVVVVRIKLGGYPDYIVTPSVYNQYDSLSQIKQELGVEDYVETQIVIDRMSAIEFNSLGSWEG